MLTGAREAVLVDPRLRALAVDVRDAVGAGEPEAPVADRVVEAVERADRGAGDAVPLRVVLAAVAGAAEAAGRERADQRHVLAAASVQLGLVLVEHGPVRLHRAAEVGAAVGDDREARLAVELAVVAHVRRAAAHLALLRVLEEGGDVPLPVRVLVERPEVDVLRLDVGEGRQDGEPEHGHGDDAADHGPEAERRALEEAAARKALAGGRRGHRGLADVRRQRGSLRGGRAPLGLDRRRRAPVLGRRLAHPEEAEDEHQRAPDRGDHLGVHDEPDQEDGDADREADRPQRRRREVRPLVTRLVGLH